MHGARARIVAGTIAIATTALLLLPACAPRRAPQRWQAVEVATDADFTGMWFTDSLNGWVTGGGWAIDGGIAGRTRDGGRTWRFQSEIQHGAGKGSGLGHVQFRDSLNGCVTASYERILVTDDGGTSWRPVPGMGPGGGYVTDIQFIDAWNGWAAGTLIARTTDGGETWRTLMRGASENGYLHANAIHFCSETRGWLVSHGGGLMWTDDGGRNWSPVALPLREGEHPTLWDITFSDASHGWVVGERGSIFHTEDGGATWALQESGVPIVRVIPKGEPPRPHEIVPELETEPDRPTVTAVAFADSTHGWAVGYYSDVAESVVLHTANAGASWEVERVQPGELLRALFVLDAEHAWAAGDRARTRPQVILRYVGAAR
jgi:photosystem II stability/assembly factor-like uncharacterized protein